MNHRIITTSKKSRTRLWLAQWCLLLLLATLSPGAYAQSTLSLSVKNESLENVLKQIEKQSDYLFFYNTDEVNKNVKITLDKKNASIQDMLDAVAKEAGLSYTIKDRHVVFAQKTVVASASATVATADRTVSGRITNEKGEPLPMVAVLEKSSRKGSFTNDDGSYTIVIPKDVANPVLVYSFVGFKTKEEVLGSRNVLNTSLADDINRLDELVVIGYSTQKKGLLTGAVSTLSMTDELKTIPTTSPGNILTGRLAGVDVQTPNGVPGTSPKITIRTAASMNKQDIVVVIDGIIRNLDQFNRLSVNEIENITVLKDAASAAIYGSRSAAGVILVTTKRGAAGKPVFNYSYNFGIDNRTKNASLTDAVQTGELYNRINGNSDPAGWAWSQEELDHYKGINGGWGYDQLDAVWKTPSVETHNLSVSGGSDKVKYFSAASYVKQKGFLEPLSYQRFNFRLNATIDITQNLQFFAGMGLSDGKQGSLTWEGAEGLYKKLLRWQPDQPVYTDDGRLADYGWIANVGGTVNGDGGYLKNRIMTPDIVLNATYKIAAVEGLSAKVVYGQNWNYNQESQFQTNYDMYILKRSGLNRHIVHTDAASILGTKRSAVYDRESLKKTVKWGYEYQMNFQLNYNRTFNGLHNVQAALVYEASERENASVYGQRFTFPTYLTDQFWAADKTSANTDGGGDANQTTGRVSYIGQFNYAYSNKYLLGFSIRRDGSMNFGPDQRWGYFPAGSVGWVVSEESFFSKEKIQNLKLRASVGLTGYDGVGGWQWQESYKDGTPSFFGTNPSRNQGITYGSVVNPKLTWEKALSYNFGVDVAAFKNWTASFDYWIKNSYDILLERKSKVPTSFSLTLPYENYGKLNSSGFDFVLGYNNSIGDFNYYANLTLSYGWNKVLKEDYAENAKWPDIKEGKALGYIAGYRYDKIIRTQDELDQFKAANPNYKIGGLSPELGMMVYKDISGADGKPDGSIDSWDKDVLYAKNFPMIYGLNLGASWKGFSIDLMLNGRIKEKKSFMDLADGYEWNRMWSDWYGDSWTPDNVNAHLPKRISGLNSNTYNPGSGITSDFWYKDASFVRLKYVNFSYTIPTMVYNKVFDKVKVFFTSTNLFVLSNFSYYDPELAAGGNFPIMRSYNFGVDITF